MISLSSFFSPALAAACDSAGMFGCWVLPMAAFSRPVGAAAGGVPVSEAARVAFASATDIWVLNARCWASLVFPSASSACRMPAMRACSVAAASAASLFVSTVSAWVVEASGVVAGAVAAGLFWFSTVMVLTPIFWVVWM